MDKTQLGAARRVVIKLGTRVLTNRLHRLDTRLMKSLVVEVEKLIAQRRQVILVSSGAIGAGMGLLKRKTRPATLPDLQACAAIGQSHLVQLYNHHFMKRKHLAAQILLTQDDLHHRHRYLNARNTLFQLLALGVVPVVNENDSVSVDELRFGDNDILAAQVCGLVEADLLIILTDVDGLHQPDGNVLRQVKEVTPSLEKTCLRDKVKAGYGAGGMRSKLKAAKIVTRTGIPVVMANGREKDVLTRMFSGEAVGTLFYPRRLKLSARKRWLAFSMMVRGRITVDTGARKALMQGGRSLLASGVSKVSGHFRAGDLVSIRDARGREFARGLAGLTQAEIKRIQGLKSDRIREILGVGCGPEVVHRNNLVIL